MALFLWKKLYAALGGGATGEATREAALDDIFMSARRLAPEVFARGNARGVPETELKQRFGVTVPLLAAKLAGIKNLRARRLLLEGYIDRLDIGLREAAVGDMVVGKRIRAMAGTINGRLQRYEPLLVAGDREGLSAALKEHGVMAADKVLAAVMPGHGQKEGPGAGVHGVKKTVARRRRLG